MPLTPYQQALEDVSAAAKLDVERIFNSWLGNVALHRVSRNVAEETALDNAAFASLLSSFAKHVSDGKDGQTSWLSACREHKRRGAEMQTADCPEVLGRVKGLDDHAYSVSNASDGALTPEEAKKLLLKHAGSLNPSGIEPFLRDALLGNHLIWATFNPDDTSANPFELLPRSHGGICTALGLGKASESLVILVWEHAHSGFPPLHRPTVADAELYEYFRPCPDASAKWGLTEPLLPNPDGLLPQPEVVMPQISSQGLRLPFEVVHV